MRGWIWIYGSTSPIEPLDSRHRIEVPVMAQEWKAILPAERGNPKVIGWNGLSGLSQLNVDGCIVVCGLLGDIQHRAIGDQTVQPAPIPSPMAGLSNAIAIFPDDHYRES